MTSVFRHARAICALGAILTIAAIAPGSAATLQVLHRLTDTGNGTKSNYKFGASPQSELLQASDGNFYGTAIEGGSGACPDPSGSGRIIGCGTIFKMTPQGTTTALYSFPYNTVTGIAPNGAYPTAGLIQGQDGYLYGVARGGGGLGRCNEPLGCGTLFRISATGAFKLLHRFCSGDGCANPTEGGQPAAHLVQLPSGALCGTTAEGGSGNNGTVFCASTAGALNTVYVFTNGADGSDPLGALLVGMDGQTLYGTTTFGGAGGQGTVFALKGTSLTTLYAFYVPPDTTGNPECALIFGADGKLYGTTYDGNPAGGIFSLNTDGSGFSSQNVFSPQIAGRAYESRSGLVLASNGLMYGMTYAGAGGDGAIFSYNPAKALYTQLFNFNGEITGAAPTDALIEGTDHFLFGTTTLYGGSNKLGQDSGTIFRLGPALK